MKRVWKLSDAAQTELLLQRLQRHSSKPKTLPPLSVFTLTKSPNHSFTRDLCAPATHTVFPTLVRLLSETLTYPDARVRKDLSQTVSALRDELLDNVDDLDKVFRVLDEKGLCLFRRHINGYAFVELMKQLGSRPRLALEVATFVILFNLCVDKVYFAYRRRLMAPFAWYFEVLVVLFCELF